VDIKFRVFCKHHNDYEPDDMKINQDGMLFHNGCLADPNTHIIELFTGLIDRKGVPIYVGDKVHVDYNFIGIITVAFSNGKFNISAYNTKKCEIVGNAHKRRKKSDG